MYVFLFEARLGKHGVLRAGQGAGGEGPCPVFVGPGSGLCSRVLVLVGTGVGPAACSRSPWAETRMQLHRQPQRSFRLFNLHLVFSCVLLSFSFERDVTECPQRAIREHAQAGVQLSSSPLLPRSALRGSLLRSRPLVTGTGCGWKDGSLGTNSGL